MRAGSLSAWMLLASTCLLSTNSVASEITAYSYDALGRLVQVSGTGSVNNGLTSSYNYDPAGNRSNVTVAGAGVVFSINDVSETEGGGLQFTVTKFGATTDSFTIDYTTANGAATAGSDFVGATSSVVFGPTDTQKTITINGLDDAAYEGTETFQINLSGAVGATISKAQGVGTIIDNEPSFTINDVAVAEGGDLVFTVTKNGTTSSSFSVSYQSANGTATQPSDYASVTGTLTFTAADPSETITIDTQDDAAVEGAETVLVNLHSPTGGAAILDAQGIGTINDNDETPPSFSINDVSVTEGGNLIFTVTKNAAKSNSYSVSYGTANGSATQPSDYTTVTGTLTFVGSDLTETVTVVTINDTAVESTETVLVNLSSPTGGSTITDSQGTGTINDNDVANQSPVANTDSLTVQACTTGTKNVVANDTDPEGDLPLTVTNVTSGNLGIASVASSTSIQFEAADTGGTETLTYTIQDSRGATDTGSLVVTVQDVGCNFAAPQGE